MLLDTRHALLLVKTVVLAFAAATSTVNGATESSKEGNLRTTPLITPPPMSLEHRRTLVGILEWKQMGGVVDMFTTGPGMNWPPVISMSRDGKRLAIGDPEKSEEYYPGGQVRAFEWDEVESNWKQMGSDINPIGDGDTHFNERLGQSISMSGNGSRIAVGAPGYSVRNETLNEEEIGYVRIYDWNGIRWENSATFDALGNDRQGIGVQLSDDGLRVAILGKQHVQVYDFSYSWNFYDFIGNPWNLVGRQDNPRSSRYLRMSGNGERILVAGDQHYYVYQVTRSDSFTRIGGDRVWSFVSASMSFTGDRVAECVEVDDYNDDVSHDIGLLDWNGSSWNRAGDDVFDTNDDNLFCSSMSLSGDGSRLLLMERKEGVSTLPVYDFDGSSWVRLGDAMNVTGEGDCHFGFTAISHDGERVALLEWCHVHHEGEWIFVYKVRVLRLDSSPTPDRVFPGMFDQVICAYRTCLGNLILKYAARTQFGSEEINGYAKTSKWKAKQAKRTIEGGGYVVRSLRRLRESMKYIQRVQGAAPGFANNIGRTASTCAINLVEDFITAFEGDDILDEELLSRMRRTRLAAAKTKRNAKEWRNSVDRSQGAIWIMMEALGEKKVPLCGN